MLIDRGRWHVVAAMALGLAAFALELIITRPPALGLSGDSAAYVQAARSFASSATLLAPNLDWQSPDSLEPLSWVPPGYPLAIAVPVRLGLAPLAGARLVQAAAAAVTVAMIFWLVSGVVGFWAGVGVAVGIVLTPAVVYAHQYLMSEPLFIACVVVSLALMVLRPDKPLWYGLSAAAACAVRYAGLPLVAVVTVWALLCEGSITRRIGRAITAVLPATLMLGWWFLRTVHMTGGSRAIRQPGIFGGTVKTFEQGLGTAVRWLAPGLRHDALRAAIALLGSVALAWICGSTISSLRRRGWPIAPDQATTTQRTILATGATWLMYALFVLVARIFGDPAIQFDDRIFSPGVICLEIGIGVAIAVWWQTRNGRQRALVAAALCVWGLLSLRLSATNVLGALRRGSLYTERDHAESPAIRWVHDEGFSYALFTNAPATLYFNAARLAPGLPAAWDVSLLRAFRDTLVTRRGAVIVFDYPSGKVAAATALVHALQLTPVKQFPDATVWMIR